MERIYEVNQVCELLQMSRGAVLRLLRLGQLRGAKLGHTWKITESAITDALRGAGSQGREEQDGRRPDHNH
jgi:excisionase family DNA binding protein